MKKQRKLGDKINRGFAGIIIILGMIFILRAAIGIAKHEWQPPYAYPEYPETQDDFAETANGLDIPLHYVDSIVDSAYVDGFFDDDSRKVEDLLSDDTSANDIE